MKRILQKLLLRLKASLGDTKAQLLLASEYYRQVGKPGCDERALYWARLAANGGEAVACFLVANLLFQRGLNENDQQEIFQAYLQAAELGHPDGEQAVAWCFEQGVGVERDVSSAILWCRRGAASGSKSCQLELARRYSEGDGVPLDTNRAAEYLKLAQRPR
jgi:TPR repeat protein